MSVVFFGIRQISTGHFMPNYGSRKSRGGAVPHRPHPPEREHRGQADRQAARRRGLSPEAVMKMHSSVTVDRVLGAVERGSSGLDNPGFCIACGVDAEGVEPDARKYECECCGAKAVYGAEELMFHVAA